LQEMKKNRNDAQVREALGRLKEAAAAPSNLMPHFIACAKAYATIGEMIDVLKEEFGEYKEPPIF
ncbi:methylmalonyl-CoA mutase family protein, partial [bacterium]|nr:methylmalonyl-CoA mutase family protein [bacterium]